MNEGSHIAETIQTDDFQSSPLAVSSNLPCAPADASHISLIDELDAYLRGLQSFFNPRNHPLTEQERTQILARDWKNELRIAGQVLLRSEQLAFDLIRNNTVGFFNSTERSTVLEAPSINSPQINGELMRDTVDADDTSLVALADALTDAQTLCDALCRAPRVSLQTWASMGRIFTRQLDRSEALLKIARAAGHTARAKLHPRLLELTERVTPDALGGDVEIIFTKSLRLLEYLRFIDSLLRRDYPLLQTLPVFSLIHEDTNRLLKFIETRVLRIENLEKEIYDVFDGTSYAMRMELRKVFEHELIGLSALRQPPLIYAKIENAHGLLRDCFQQSIVGLAQTLDQNVDAIGLFDAFNTKLEQSLTLRRDLWTLLGLVRRMEQERDRRPFVPVLERLQTFQQGSMRYLMYKDWEAYERFIEEASAARGTVELAPVLHRFGTYLETLFGQINMRAALVAHPFDYPPAEN